MGRQSSFSLEVRERAIRLVAEQKDAHNSLWSIINSVASKIGRTPETLRRWIEKAESENSQSNVSDKDRIKQLERENRELKKSYEILRLGSAYFAQAELDRRPR